jgi:hypothetical protein
VLSSSLRKQGHITTIVRYAKAPGSIVHPMERGGWLLGVRSDDQVAEIWCKSGVVSARLLRRVTDLPINAPEINRRVASLIEMATVSCMTAAR